MQKKENDIKLISAGVIAALAASICCITPVLAILAGIGGAASLFSWLDPFRPYLLALTVGLLLFAWYQKLKPKTKDVACDCDQDQQKKTFTNSKRSLFVVTIIVLLLLSFPYYSSIFFYKTADKSVAAAEPVQLQQAILKIQGMTCVGCESSINHVLSSKEGVLEAKASYENGMASVTYDPDFVNPEILKKAVEQEVGYAVTDIKLINMKKD
ncbi:MAG: mercuric transport protein MerTP [Candidatus Cyclobacteriaceae bacterium M2_1C_046]